MNVQPEIIVDHKSHDEITEHVQNVTDRFEALVQIRVNENRPDFQQSVRPPDNLPDLPFIWSNNREAQLRARRWWLAHLREMGLLNAAGGRYQRTGEMVKGWDLRLTLSGDGGQVDSFNNANGAEFVYGDRQVPSHKLTGWGLVSVQLRERGEILGAGFAEDWFNASEVP